MLGHFPTLYPDEILYSALARYHQLSVNMAQKQTIRDLYGTRLVGTTVDLPSHINLLCTKIDYGYSVDDLIQQHTLYPYYSAFLRKEKAKDIYNLMSDDSTWGMVHSRLGLPACTIKSPIRLRFCKTCYEDDALCFKEPYWHRIHQVPGVLICAIHKIALTNSNVPYPARGQKFNFIPLVQIELSQNDEMKLKRDWLNILILISEQSGNLLSSKDQLINYEYLYRNKLVVNGYTTVGGNIRFAKLVNDFCDFYSEELLRYLNCEVEKNLYDTWFHKTLRGKDEMFHPLRHILLSIFFGLEITEHEHTQPFGYGPWPCLNKTADHYKHDLIKKCTITRCSKTGFPIGTFQCVCGFIYSRKGPDANKDVRYKIGRIKAFGHVWYQRLQEIDKENISLRAKATLLGVDPGTVKHHVESLYKPSSIANLTGNDRLIAKSKNKTKRVNIRQKKTKDWNQRDGVLLQEVIEIVRSFRNDKGKPQRITAAAIFKRLDRDVVTFLPEKCLAKLPQTKAYLLQYLETTEQFQIRRLEWSAEVLKSESSIVQDWELLKKAGLSKPLREGVALRFICMTSERDGV